MNDNDPGGLSPQQVKTLGIMGGLFVLCFVVMSLVSDLDLPGPVPSLIKFAPTGIILVAAYYAARHVSSASDDEGQTRSAEPAAPSARKEPDRSPEAELTPSPLPTASEGATSWLQQARNRLSGEPSPARNQATIAGAIARAQLSGTSVISLFMPDDTLPTDTDALGAQLVEATLSHIRALDETASITISGSSTWAECTLNISALTAYAPVLGARAVDEIRALAASTGGSVDTDTQADTWTLTARLPTAAGAPA